MNRYTTVSLFLGLWTFAIFAASLRGADAPLVRVSSPNGQTRIEIVLQRHQEFDAAPHWRAFFKDKPIIQTSHLGIELGDGARLGGSCVVEAVETRSYRNRYDISPGKRRHVLDHCTETIVSLRERTPPRRRWQLVLRAYDDGVAFRYRFPAQEGWKRLEIAAERTEFALPEDARAFVLPLKGFVTPYEALYQTKRMTEKFPDGLVGLPLLLDCPGRGWAAITEANLTDYAGMYLAKKTARSPVLHCRLAPLPKEPKFAVKATLPHASPWRVVMLADDPCRMIESDLLLHLNEPCAVADTSWIKTGKTTFPWWNGYHLEKVSFKPGLNTATMKHYIDFCAENGIQYHSLDGLDNIAWYGGPIVPYKGANIVQGIDGLDLPEVIRYAKNKGVRLRIWMHWEAAKKHMDRAFPLYRSWGIEGVMLDFMDREDQEMVNFRRDVLRQAAANHLTVTLHGMAKPTGLERTYPHLLNSEGVLNLEYDKWDKLGCPPEHEVTVPFARMLAGPLDFHQGSLRGVPVKDFKPRNAAPLVMGTASRMLATYVVFQNHLPMVADYPAAYHGHPALKMLAKIPTTWDDTKVLNGRVGEYIVLARRDGTDWYIGGMNDRRARTLEASLRFLGPGRYRAEIYDDDAERKLARHHEEVSAQDVLKIPLVSAGGFLVRLTPLPKKPVEGKLPIGAKP